MSGNYLVQVLWLLLWPQHVFLTLPIRAFINAEMSETECGAESVAKCTGIPHEYDTVSEWSSPGLLGHQYPLLPNEWSKQRLTQPWFETMFTKLQIQGVDFWLNADQTALRSTALNGQYELHKILLSRAGYNLYPEIGLESSFHGKLHSMMLSAQIKAILPQLSEVSSFWGIIHTSACIETIRSDLHSCS